VLTAWHPAIRIDRDLLRRRRDLGRARREFARQVLADLAGSQLHRSPAPAAPRGPHEILQAIASDRLGTLSHLVRPVPFTAWHEWERTLDLARQRFPLARPGPLRHGPPALSGG
jgi:hypothetical protein